MGIVNLLYQGHVIVKPNLSISKLLAGYGCLFFATHTLDFDVSLSTLHRHTTRESLRGYPKGFVTGRDLSSGRGLSSSGVREQPPGTLPYAAAAFCSEASVVPFFRGWDLLKSSTTDFAPKLFASISIVCRADFSISEPKRLMSSFAMEAAWILASSFSLFLSSSLKFFEKAFPTKNRHALIVSSISPLAFKIKSANLFSAALRARSSYWIA